MNRCEHGQKITKFCVTEHCHHRQSAGCDYCMKRYHFHLTNTILLSQTNVQEIIKKLTLPTDSKFKTRILQESAIDYLRTIKHAVNNWFDQAQNAIADRLSHPMMRRHGMLPTYNRLKYREYRKINAKDLRGINDFAKNTSSQELKKDEVEGYFDQVQWTKSILNAAEFLAQDLVKLPQVKQGEGPITLPSKSKTDQILESIGRQMNKRRSHDKTSLPSSNLGKSEGIGFSNSTLMKKRQEKKENKTSVVTAEDNNAVAKKGSISMEPEQEQAFSKIPAEEDKQTRVEKERKLKRRRSSIDDKFDLKFGADADDKAKEIEERRKRMTEKIGNDKGDDSIIGNLLNLKYGIKDTTKRQQKQKQSSSQHTSSDKNTKQDGSNDKFNLGMGAIQNLIQNILPPLQDQVKKKDDEPIKTNVIKIPVVMKGPIDQIQSPIWKKRSQAKPESSGFGIKLNQAFSDKVEEPKEDQKPVILKPIQTDKKDDELIVLERNEKNSLLLFSQSLKAESQKAIELLKAALKYSPNNLSAAEYLSYLYLQGGRAKECLEVCQSILLRIQDTAEEFQLTLHLHNNRAAALNMLGRYSQSIMVLQKCLRSRRKHYFYKNLADAYFSLGIPQKAAMNYEKAVKLDPQYDEAYYNLAVTQFMQQEYTSALMNVKEAVRIDMSNDNYIELEREITNRKNNIMI